MYKYYRRRIEIFLLFVVFHLPVFAGQEVLTWSISKIPAEIEERMKVTGSWKEGCPVAISDLAYLRLSYHGYDGKTYTDGVMVVKKDVAKEVIDIFKELYKNKFPIEKIKLIDDYNAQDDPSMEDNNTSAFNCRPVYGQSTGFSLHSYGTAIDINPKINPYVKTKEGKQSVAPKNGEPFIDRSKKATGMIIKGDACSGAFVRRGWVWGGTGEWLSKRCNQDYQHFQKQGIEQKSDCKR